MHSEVALNFDCSTRLAHTRIGSQLSLCHGLYLGRGPTNLDVSPLFKPYVCLWAKENSSTAHLHTHKSILRRSRSSYELLFCLGNGSEVREWRRRGATCFTRWSSLWCRPDLLLQLHLIFCMLLAFGAGQTDFNVQQPTLLLRLGCLS